RTYNGALTTEEAIPGVSSEEQVS
ncbi:MAG: hypothetical protein RI911_715, partial [Candidatus Parcubacteria bacterium]